jgi:hypothetical protein
VLDEALAPFQMGRIDHMLRQIDTSISEIRAMPNLTGFFPRRLRVDFLPTGFRPNQNESIAVQ